MKEIIQLKLAFGLEMPLPELTPREVRLPQIPGKAHAVIGMRRSGKTYFLFQQLQHKLENKVSRDRLVYFNFEDDRLDGMRADQLGLVVEEYYRQFPDYRHNKKVTFGFDEIQRISGWEAFIRRLLDEEKVELLLTGSSAKLLSREVATAMRGRATETVISPFSFREFIDHHGVPRPGKLLSAAAQSKLLNAFDRYFEIGGFPEAQAISHHDWVQLLQGYVDIVLFRDVVERHGVSNVIALRALVRQLLRSGGLSLSVSKIYNDFKSQGIRVSKESLLEFMQHLKDSFLIHTASIFSRSERQKNSNPRKIYLADHALVKAFSPIPTSDKGHLLENIVACELFRYCHSVNYYRTKSGYEVDFLAIDYSGKESLIQVASSISDKNTLNREVRALSEGGKERPEASLLLLTMSDTQTITTEHRKEIQVMPAWRWLLQK
ncbi:MAG: ATP-binding protein [Proteobacteria bacterium]|nr:ATP-binding protein [Pseudomonadota bacterium]